jgi:hypothetical protein
MKRKIITSVAAIVIMLFFFTGCDKYHRDRYTGTWEFVTESILRQFDYDSGEYFQIECDTLYFSGKISRDKAADELKIEYKENYSIILKINACGKLYGFSHNSFCGEFYEADKIDLFFWWDESGILKTESVSGSKISEK